MSARALGRPLRTARFGGFGGFGRALALAVALIATSGSYPVQAQDAGVPGVRDVPSGDGTLRGVVRHPDGPEKAAGLSIALYALDADGMPSLRSTTTDANGAFRFDDITSASGVTYLVGARYRDIPYGKRVRFEAAAAGAGDRPVIDMVIDVADPTADVSAVTVAESKLQVGWMGDSLAIQESHLLRNAGDAVVYVEPSERANAAPPFVAHLPDRAADFTPAFGSLQSDFERMPGGELRYWGSIHPGEQSVSYRYLLPVSGESVDFEALFPSGSAELTILVPLEDPEIRATGAVPGDETLLSGQRFRTWDAGPIDPGGGVALQLQAPEQRNDPGALEIKLATAWIELDDTALSVLIEYTLSVAPGGRLVGTPESPLLAITLPPGAELMGLSPNASRLGLQRGRAGGSGSEGGVEDQSIELLGPIPSGSTQLSYRYRLPARSGAGGSTRLDLRFPRAVPQVNVMVADTGVVIEDDRMHRRRPTRSGTRLYLHREAFQVAADETISLRLTPLGRRLITPSLALAPILLAAAAAAWFMVAPLRPSDSSIEDSSSEFSTRDRRESIYDAIRDLDHDFETGKLSPEDHAEMRAELRQQAVEFMRLETSETGATHSTTHPPTEAARPAAEAPLSAAGALAAGSASASPLAPTPALAAATATARFCPACGGKAESGWAFCARCGKAMPKLGDGDA